MHPWPKCPFFGGGHWKLLEEEGLGYPGDPAPGYRGSERDSVATRSSASRRAAQAWKGTSRRAQPGRARWRDPCVAPLQAQQAPALPVPTYPCRPWCPPDRGARGDRGRPRCREASPDRCGSQPQTRSARSPTPHSTSGALGGGAVGTARGLGGAAFASRCGAGSRGAQAPGGILDCLLPGRGGILAAMVSDGEGRAGRDPPTPGLGGLGLARTTQVEHYVGGRVQPVWSLGE